MLKALAEELDMVFTRRKSVRMGGEFIPKFADQNQLLLQRETLELSYSFSNHFPKITRNRILFKGRQKDLSCRLAAIARRLRFSPWDSN